MRLTFCGRCGTRALPGDDVCRRCGAPLVIGGEDSPAGPSPYSPGVPDVDDAAAEATSLRWYLGLGVLGALAAVVVAVVLFLALRSGGGSPALVAADSPTPPPARSPSARAATPSAVPRTPTAVPTPLPPQAVLASKGFAPVGDVVVTDDGSGGRLSAVKGVCQGSADGYCQQVFFFDNGQYLGTDTLATSRGIINVAAGGAAKIAITYAQYAPEDPLCCPSLAPVTIVYTWTGSTLEPSGTPPGH